MESRKHTRLSVENDSIASIKGCDFRKGTIRDISPSGLSFNYHSKETPGNGFKFVDISLDGSGFHIPKLPCQIVYDTPDSSSNANGEVCHKCGVRFGEMDDEHKNLLNYFLSNFTTGVARGKNLSHFFIDRARNLYRFLIPMLLDFMLLAGAMICIQYFKRGSLSISTLYAQLFSIFSIGWFGVSFLMDKHRKILHYPFFDAMAVIVKSNFFLLYVVSFTIVLFSDLSTVSRTQTFGTCTALFLLEITVYLLYAFVKRPWAVKNVKKNVSSFHTAETPSYPLIIIDAALLLTAFFLMNLLKRGNISLPPRYDQALIILYALWGFSSFYSGKFKRSIFNSAFTHAFNHCIRSAVIMVASLGVVIFALRLFYYSRLQLFAVPVLLLALEGAVYYFYWLYRKQGRIGKDIETGEAVREVVEVQDANQVLPTEKCDVGIAEPVETRLRHALEFFDPKLCDFITDTIDLSSIDRCGTTLTNTEDIEDLTPLSNNGLQLFINLHKTNDVRWFNRYFLEVYRKLKNQGYFIGKAHTFSTHRLHFREKYPKRIADALYFSSCIWSRIFPKLPFLKKLYFTVTKGRNRMASKAEIFGRLYYCGFKVVSDMEIGNRLYFIARKVRIPSYQTNPTYGPLVQLKRFGFEGKVIPVYKFRTMFAYSEFLQEYIYENNQLDEGGKFKNDFRVTGWGKLMRALWLDELPMLYNWLKGDMKLFGVRPISKQYLSLYTDELKDLRKKVVPGLIPPFYADLPKTLPEIIDSEVRYIKSYLNSPARTQLIYFWQSFRNIVLKGVRSK